MNKNPITSKILSLIYNFNEKRKEILKQKLYNYKNKKIILIGASYKKNSYSITNSNFKKLFDKIKIFDDQFQLKDFNNKNVIKNLGAFSKFDIFIYNYSNKSTLSTIKKILKRNKKKND